MVYRYEALPQALRSRINTEASACWLWTAASSAGRGRAWSTTRGEVDLAYRVVYELLVGPVPDGHELHHRCEVPLCVRPAEDHVVALTPKLHRAEHGPSGIAAIHAARETCVNGHVMTGVDVRGNRQCLVCKHERQREYDHKPDVRERHNARRRARRKAARGGL